MFLQMSMTSLPATVVSSTQSTPATFPAIEEQSKISQGESVEHQNSTVPSRPPGSFDSTQKSESQAGTRRKSRTTKSNTDARTTVMLRNLPSYSTREMLLDILDSLGFKGKYDFVHMPVDIKRLSCLGFGFVNFRTHEDTLQFFERAEGFCNWKTPSSRILNVLWSDPLQGLLAQIQRYRNAAVMHPSVPAECKPLIFGTDGEPAPFPKPTISIRAPRIC